MTDADFAYDQELLRNTTQAESLFCILCKAAEIIGLDVNDNKKEYRCSNKKEPSLLLVASLEI